MEFDKAKFMEKLKELVAYGKKEKERPGISGNQRLFPRYAAGCGADGEGI